jgi:YVTN family beta-propeller protein
VSSSLLGSLTRCAALALSAAVASGCGRSCGSSAEHAPSLAYVSDEEGGTVVVVDLGAGQVVARVPVGKRPRGMKLSRDGKLLYVALSGSPRGGPGIDESKLPPADRSADGVGIVDLAARKLLRTLPSGQDPESFDLSPDGEILYVSNEDAAELTALDVSSGAVRGKAHVGREPEGVAVRPDGSVVFVTSEQDGEVTVVGAKDLAVVAHIPVAPRPRSIVFTKDGATAFVTSEVGAKVTVVDAGAYKALGDIELHADSPKGAPRPMGEALSSDGTKLYISCGRGGSVAVVDVAARKQVRSFEGVGDRPWGIAVSADGALLYTANGTSHDVSIVNPVTGNVDRRIETGGLPWGIVLGSAL